jgi:alpha-tubulin suppressor-like RCC1 family protein
VDPGDDGSCVGAIAAGSYTTCALRSDGTVRCWGYNVNQRLGDGQLEHEPCSTGSGDCSTKPVSVTGVNDARFAVGGENSFCMVNAAHELWCWGWDMTNGTDIDLGVVEHFGSFTVQAASLRLPLGALDDQGRVWMAGYDDQGKGVFGDGATAPGTLREFSGVPVLENATALDVGWQHSCAVLDSNAVVCWGRGLSGEIGDGELVDRYVPTAVTTLNDQPAVSVAVGDAVSCALIDGGSVWCWGGNDRGQLGRGDPAASSQAASVDGLLDAVEIDAGFGHVCARRATGNVVCWGNDRFGQLGDEGEHDNCSDAVPEPCSYSPVEVSGLHDAVAISVGRQHSCALRATGDVVCWGRNDHGQLGNGSFDGAPTPVTVIEL